jgi:hypothetical protein
MAVFLVSVFLTKDRSRLTMAAEADAGAESVTALDRMVVLFLSASMRYSRQKGRGGGPRSA